MASTAEYQRGDLTRDYKRDWMRAKRVEVLRLLGDKCVRCGFKDPRALQADHVNGGGHRLRDKERSQAQLLRAVQAAPERFQLLCANCNNIKRIENNENRRRAD